MHFVLQPTLKSTPDSRPLSQGGNGPDALTRLASECVTTVTLRRIGVGIRAQAQLYDTAVVLHAQNLEASYRAVVTRSLHWQAEVCRVILTSRAGMLDCSSTAQSCFSGAPRSPFRLLLLHHVAFSVHNAAGFAECLSRPVQASDL